MLGTVFTQSVTSRILWRAIVARPKTVITFSLLLFIFARFFSNAVLICISPFLLILHSLFLPPNPPSFFPSPLPLITENKLLCAENPSDSKRRAKTGTTIESSTMAVCDATHWVERIKIWIAVIGSTRSWVLRVPNSRKLSATNSLKENVTSALRISAILVTATAFCRSLPILSLINPISNSILLFGNRRLIN